MSEKRRGLGRGLGALIPTGPEGRRPVDVFFPEAPQTLDDNEPGDAAPGVAAGAGGGDATANEGISRAPEGDAGSVSRAHDVASGTARPGLDGDSSSNAGGAASKTDPDAERGTAVADAGAGGAEARQDSVAGSGAADDQSATTIDDGAADSGAGQAAARHGVSAHDDDGLVPVPGASFAELPVSAIEPNPRQPRTVFDEGELDELVDSIREIGVLQPIVVRPSDNAGQYQLVMGERRWRAAQAAGLDAIPAIVRETEDSDLLRDALLENLHRAALNPLEEAAAYRQLLDDFGCTHEELAARIFRSRPQISNTLRLLRLPPLVQRRVAAGVLSAGHARALLGLTDGAEIERLAQRIVAEGLSVRATEEIVALGTEPQRPARSPRAGQRSAAIDELASRLSDRFETRVRVDLGKSKGRVTVEFASVEDLNRILDIMAPNDPGLLRQ